MVLVDWWFPGVLSAALIMIALAVYGLKAAARIAARFKRVAVQLVCAFVALFGSLAAILLLAASGCRNHSAPIYSPSRSAAARIENADEGATGGSTSVELFWAHGFREQTVYFGLEQSVEPSDIQWISDSELKIHHSGDYAADSHICKSTARVKVSCLPR